MNKRLLIAAMAIIFASAFVIFGTSGIVQSAHACPNKGTSVQGPTSSNNVNLQLIPQSPQLISGQSAWVYWVYNTISYSWYDSINKIGASKEVLIAGPLEIVIIVILARAFLREKLTRFHFIGIALALVGFFMAITSDIPLTVPDNTEKSTTVTSSAVTKSSSLSAIVIGFGDVEAILSAFGFAGGVIFLTKLAIKYSSIEVAGASMFTSGLILVGFMVVGLMSYGTSHAVFTSNEISLRQPLINSIAVLLLFSLLPFIGSLSYSTGLSRIGASLTATLGSSSILITIVLQIMLKEFGINSHLPENIFLAILGGVTGFLGIYVIHIPSHSMSITKEE